MGKPSWTLRPEQWLDHRVQKEIEENPLVRNRTDAIHALIQKTTDLEAKLKVAKADVKTWKIFAESMAKFANEQGWRQGQAPPKAPTE